MTFTYCPDCDKKGVSLRRRPEGDHYACRYCDFYFYTHLQDAVDRENQQRWEKRNNQ